MRRLAAVLTALVLFVPVAGDAVDTVPNVTHSPGTTEETVTVPLQRDPITDPQNIPNGFWFSMEGHTQGKITERCSTKDSIPGFYNPGHEDECRGLSFNHAIIVPRDPQTGQPTGYRVHQPMTIVTPWNASVPRIFKALTSGERMKKVRLRFFTTTTAIGEIDLEEAVIVSLREYTDGPQLLVEISLTYRKIIVRHMKSGTQGADDWKKPKA